MMHGPTNNKFESSCRIYLGHFFVSHIESEIYVEEFPCVQNHV